MSQPEISKDWKEIVPELTSEENRILLIQLNHPVVVKYFQRVALDAMVMNSVSQLMVNSIAKDDRSIIAEAAYMRGKLEVASTIIDAIIEYQKAIQPKKQGE